MFSLLSGLWQYLFSKTEVQVLIIGLDNAGKTTVLERLKNIFLKTPEISAELIPPTIGMNLGKMEIAGNKAIFWDLGGQQSLRSIWDHYFQEADAVLFVLDAADPSRFAEARAALQNVIGHRELRPTVPLAVMANKQDVGEARGAAECGAALGVDEGAAGAGAAAGRADGEGGGGGAGSSAREVRVTGVSAKTYAGIEEAAVWLVQTAAQLKKELPGQA